MKTTTIKIGTFVVYHGKYYRIGHCHCPSDFWEGQHFHLARLLDESLSSITFAGRNDFNNIEEITKEEAIKVVKEEIQRNIVSYQDKQKRILSCIEEVKKQNSHLLK